MSKPDSFVSEFPPTSHISSPAVLDQPDPDETNDAFPGRASRCGWARLLRRVRSRPVAPGTPAAAQRLGGAALQALPPRHRVPGGGPRDLLRLGFLPSTHLGGDFSGDLQKPQGRNKPNFVGFLPSTYDLGGDSIAQAGQKTSPPSAWQASCGRPRKTTACKISHSAKRPTYFCS